MLWCRRLPVFAGLAMSMILTGCDTIPRPGAAASTSSSSGSKSLIPDRIVDSLAAADKAQKLGKTSSALEELDDAIRVEPSSKLPWLRKAQIYFDARQYGQAITAAQEVLQRDASDLTAKSILAVSGLRVSAQALEQLRKANEVSGSARSEAESVAKVIREALGEPILVGSPVKPADTPRSTSRPASAKATSTARSTAPLSVPPPAAGPAKTTASSSSSRGNNPFGALQ